MTKRITGEKVDVVLHMALFSLNNTVQQAILDEASHQLHRDVTWDDIEDYEVTLEVKLSLY